jgi:hypothetical protein
MDKIKPKFKKIKDKISEKFNRIKKFIVQNNVEILIFLGLFFIVLASFLVNFILALYILGGILMGLGIFLLKFPSKSSE